MQVKKKQANTYKWQVKSNRKKLSNKKGEHKREAFAAPAKTLSKTTHVTCTYQTYQSHISWYIINLKWDPNTNQHHIQIQISHALPILHQSQSPQWSRYLCPFATRWLLVCELDCGLHDGLQSAKQSLVPTSRATTTNHRNGFDSKQFKIHRVSTFKRKHVDTVGWQFCAMQL